jgi:hypothetical protein
MVIIDCFADLQAPSCLGNDEMIDGPESLEPVVFTSTIRVALSPLNFSDNIQDNTMPLNLIEKSHHDVYPAIDPKGKLQSTAEGKVVVLTGAGKGIGEVQILGI